MGNITLEDIRDGYKELFLRNPANTDCLVIAGSISCLIEDIIAIEELDIEEETELSQ